MKGCTSNNLHDCVKVVAKIQLALDGALNTSMERDFLDQVEQCPSCLKKFDVEKSFKQFLVEKIERKSTNEDLANSIRKKLGLS